MINKSEKKVSIQADLDRNIFASGKFLHVEGPYYLMIQVQCSTKWIFKIHDHVMSCMVRASCITEMHYTHVCRTMAYINIFKSYYIYLHLMC